MLEYSCSRCRVCARNGLYWCYFADVSWQGGHPLDNVTTSQQQTVQHESFLSPGNAWPQEIILCVHHAIQKIYAQAKSTLARQRVHAPPLRYSVVHDPFLHKHSHRADSENMGYFLHLRLQDFIQSSFGFPKNQRKATISMPGPWRNQIYSGRRKWYFYQWCSWVENLVPKEGLTRNREIECRRHRLN